MRDVAFDIVLASMQIIVPNKQMQAQDFAKYTDDSIYGRAYEVNPTQGQTGYCTNFHSGAPTYAFEDNDTSGTAIRRASLAEWGIK